MQAIKEIVVGMFMGAMVSAALFGPMIWGN
jgi:hypothetical protein